MSFTVEQEIAEDILIIKIKVCENHRRDDLIDESGEPSLRQFNWGANPNTQVNVLQ
jgi:hypothetical protein